MDDGTASSASSASGASGASGASTQQSRYRMELKTVQAVAFKVLIEALKELLSDATIDFDASGLKIMALTISRAVLVHLKLDASKFEYYKCDSPLSISVNLLNLHKLFKTINNNNTLSLFVDRDDLNHLGVKIENTEKASKTTYRVTLLDMMTYEVSPDDNVFTEELSMSSADFQKICRDMSNIAEEMEIRCVRNNLIFSCKGDFCSQETVITYNEGNADMPAAVDNDRIVQGVFSIPHLVMFTKCTNLSPMMTLYLTNDYPLIINLNLQGRRRRPHAARADHGVRGTQERAVPSLRDRQPGFAAAARDQGSGDAVHDRGRDPHRPHAPDARPVPHPVRPVLLSCLRKRDDSLKTSLFTRDDVLDAFTWLVIDAYRDGSVTPCESVMEDTLGYREDVGDDLVMMSKMFEVTHNQEDFVLMKDLDNMLRKNPINHRRASVQHPHHGGQGLRRELRHENTTRGQFTH
ncbi:hypothetical protein CEUSTIGMA_g13136.t1 [Chlamydomonas eustigma]|uniref:DNA sliding clamp PCNA n=1 Tax=Chlamydomonas eustigma TaxID=1157962 RepID=A0A250XRK9_9CHLO|nr:hypothetical protein CEUSTIGMA_g13136.t1 [Chlamydomonas eustigma]|eukprot:GAX85721.1 hypothetical protein CEUSTIGMA_g13136.t1 [Chlamydomonas eustigma]